MNGRKILGINLKLENQDNLNMKHLTHDDNVNIYNMQTNDNIYNIYDEKYLKLFTSEYLFLAYELIFSPFPKVFIGLGT